MVSEATRTRFGHATGWFLSALALATPTSCGEGISENPVLDTAGAGHGASSGGSVASALGGRNQSNGGRGGAANGGSTSGGSADGGATAAGGDAGSLASGGAGGASEGGTTSSAGAGGASQGGAGGDGASGGGVGGDSGGAGGSAAGTSGTGGDPGGGGGACEFVTCGGRLWTNGVIPFRIAATEGSATFSPEDIAQIREAATRWNYWANEAFLFRECPDGACPTSQRFLEIRPKLTENAAGDVTYLQPSSEFAVVTHLLGHVLGLSHTFQRNDRDRYVSLVPVEPCDAFEAPPRCKEWPSSLPSEPPIPTGMFGPYDDQSVMNFEPDAGTCAVDVPMPSPGTPTNLDVSAAIELYRTEQGWAPFQSLGKERGTNMPLDYELDTAVTQRGSPAVVSTELDNVEFFVRGTDNSIFTMSKVVTDGTFTRYTEWDHVGCCFTSDPAVTSWGGGRVDLTVSADGVAFLRQRVAGEWLNWARLGKPSAAVTVAEGSAPALATWGSGHLAVFVRGDDNKLYTRTCLGDATEKCAVDSSAWGPWSLIAGAEFMGSPSATSTGFGKLVVGVHGLDNTLWLARFDGTTWTWSSIGSGWLKGWDSASATSPAITSSARDRIDAFIIGGDDRLWYGADVNGVFGGYSVQGGILTGSASAFATRQTGRIEVVAPVNDRGTLGTWRKYKPYQHPCYVNEGCGDCGCGGPKQPSCVEGPGE